MLLLRLRILLVGCANDRDGLSWGNAQFGVDFALETIENGNMVIHGRVQNGVVVLEGGPVLPEGAAVIVSFPAPQEGPLAVAKKRIDVPLVRSDRPGSLSLNGERIAEILDDEDVSPRY
jgi:hypothetical protein